MKKTELKEFRIMDEIILAVFCDFCGDEIEKHYIPCEGYGKIHVEFGYPSDYDGDIYKGEICDDCFKKIFKDKLELINPNA
jgi:hypothetical protein